MEKEKEKKNPNPNVISTLHKGRKYLREWQFLLIEADF